MSRVELGVELSVYTCGPAINPVVKVSNVGTSSITGGPREATHFNLTCSFKLSQKL